MLTGREREVVRLAANGFSHKAAANALGITERTVEAHLRSAREKLNAKNTPNLIYLAQKAGIISTIVISITCAQLTGSADVIRPRTRVRVSRLTRSRRESNKWALYSRA